MQHRIHLKTIGALLLVLALYSPNAFAQKTWVGGSNFNDWHTAANWSPSGVPVATDPVIFDLPSSSVVIATAVTVASLQVDASVNIGMTANATLTVTGATSLGASAQIDIDGSAATLLQLNGAVSFSAGSGFVPTRIWSSVATGNNGVRVVKLGSAATLSMGDLQGTYFGTGVNVWITRDTGLLQSPVRFEDDVTMDAEFNPGAHNVWLGVRADIIRSGYNNQTQNFISFSNTTLETGMVIKNIAYWQDGNGNYVTSNGYFNWEVGVSKIAAIAVDVNYAEYATWTASATEPFRGVGVRAVKLEHPDNQATNKYGFYWVVQPIGLRQDNGPGFPGSSTTDNNICYEVEFHPGYIQGSPQNVMSARYSNNFEEVGLGGGAWYIDGSVETSTNNSGRIFVPQCPAYGFGDITIGTGTDPVPVELTAFSARYIDGLVRLNWQTATELNNFGFAIERSQDGEGWEEVGFVPGFGNSSSPKSYAFEDVLDGDLLRVPQLAYRLRQMDRDGTTDYSNIVFVSTGELPESVELYAAYPNPFNPTTTISFAIKNAANVTLKVYNTFGQEVASLLANSTMDAGLHTVPFNGDQLPSGVYMAVLEADGALQQQKLVLNK